MTAEEAQAKREWGTGACQANGCTTRSAFLVMEGDDWWLYCCPKHAKQYADQHGIEMPPRAPAPSRRFVAQ
jgi:hypothetical protein